MRGYIDAESFEKRRKVVELALSRVLARVQSGNVGGDELRALDHLYGRDRDPDESISCIARYVFPGGLGVIIATGQGVKGYERLPVMFDVASAAMTSRSE